jgi:ABC-type lipopolysaccharide export system ATPase subunit
MLFALNNFFERILNFPQGVVILNDTVQDMFTMHAIGTLELTKQFEGLKSVDSLNLEIANCELFGLLGPKRYLFEGVEVD